MEAAIPFNGSGTFNRVYSWVVDAANGIDITASRMDTEEDGFATGLSNCLTRDGQGKPSAAIDWNGQNLTNIAALANTGNATLCSTSGLMRAGIGSAVYAAHAFTRGTTGQTVLYAVGASVGWQEGTTLNSADAAGYSTAGAAQWVGKNNGTGRSINAAGTLNASGADYAEYMTKAAGCGTITKGAVCGVTANDELTDVYANAHSFVIKSTDPAYVGGDTWFSEAPPKQPTPPEGTEAPACELAAYALDCVDWQARYDAARANVDRVAFAGRVPVNVTGAKAGQFIVATHDGTGIAGVPMWPVDMDDADRERVVGKVWKVLPDGRAWVKVL